MKTVRRLVMLASALMAISGSANATILTVFDGIAAGSASFTNIVTGAGATVTTDIWAGIPSNVLTVSRPGYTITRNDGNNISPSGYGSMSGQVVDISPNGSFPGQNGTISAGITFLFSAAVNSFGFEVGDWATCCFNPTTDLFISFDDGAPIMVASADESADGIFGGVNEIFVAAFNDAGNFTKVQFWGNGSGEFLVIGGQLKYALVGRGTLPPNGVPEPLSMALVGIGLLGMGLSRRRKSS